MVKRALKDLSEMMYPRKQLDWSWALLFHGFFYLLFSNRKKAQEKLERTCPDALFLLSIRTGWDAFLSCSEWEKGEVILMSAITIPHMRDLVIEHGYEPVGVDLELQTLSVSTEALRLAIQTHRPKAFVFAHLLGSYTDLTELKEICSNHDVLLIEDCAQAFNGIPLVKFVGDVAMFSFGTIKTTTALGGSIVYFRDPIMREKVRATIASYTTQKNSVYTKKLLRSMAFLILFPPYIFGILAELHKDYDAFLRSASTGFSGEGWLLKIRQRPSSAMLAMLSYRTTSSPSKHLDDRRKTGEIARRVFQKHGLEIMGSKASNRTHWLLCLHLEKPAEAVSRCRKIGFDLTEGASVMIALGGTNSLAAMNSIVYIPCYARLKESHYDAIAHCICESS